MIGKVLYFIIFLACLFITKQLKDKAVNRTLIDVYNATKEEDEERFLRALQQKGFKVFVSSFTTQFLKLKFYINCDNYEKVQEVLKEVKIERLKLKDRLAVNQLMFSYSVERSDYEQIQYYRDALLKDLKQKENYQMRYLIDEVELIYSIFIKKDSSLITYLDSRIAESRDAAALAVLYYYKARLCYAKKDLGQCKNALAKSINASKNEKWKAKIENILSSGLTQLN